ncbi:hypothetical protein DKX38_020556 [Salix brachista]|uniref:EF-hand domain-containing protein n=1 Tax=Salix brachista TaxID=2182728 RepID=A0A5N5K5K6_9ROSI|nr:hypothetical protein DKX38_020556 [Salix brachista]
MAIGGMNMEEFTAWVRKNIDADEDGKISKDELADFIRRLGEWFAGWKARKLMRSADSNRNGVIDEIEIGNLAEFAQKHLDYRARQIISIWTLEYKIQILELFYSNIKQNVPTSCRLSVDGKRVMSIEEFKRWLKTFDADKDGRISRKELEDAMPGGWFTRWKGKRGVRSADSDGNGFIEESEINNLVELAQKYLGVKILQL